MNEGTGKILATRLMLKVSQEFTPELPTGTITLLFSDIEGSTQLLQQLGERYTGVLAECRSLLRTALHVYGGHETDTQRDAFFVAFARATNAISAVVASQRAPFTHAWPDGVAVQVRMGLHTGELSLAAEGYVGLDVHWAARFMGAGHGGQVLLLQTTRALVEHDLPDGVLLRDLGMHRLRDIVGSTHVYQLDSVNVSWTSQYYTDYQSQNENNEEKDNDCFYSHDTPPVLSMEDLAFSHLH
jgi:class 3 adenylate cyclase